VTPRQLASEIRVAHEGRDHDTHGKALALLRAHEQPRMPSLARSFSPRWTATSWRPAATRSTCNWPP
jgi:hypothetical protein